MYYPPYGYPDQPRNYWNGSMQHSAGNPTYQPCPNGAMQAYPSQHNYFPYQTAPTDYGPQPFVLNIDEATKQNNTFRTAIWTGTYLQATLMSLQPGESIGLEIHPDVDQFIRIEQGEGITQMGKQKDRLDFQAAVAEDSAIFIPAGAWHNLTNTGRIPLKLYSIYAPPNHPFGTIHPTKAAAMAAEYGSE
ncbi:cupin domain-containing protein [Sporosarcina sp. ITBMC105]